MRFALRGLGILLLVFVVFHRPLLQWTLRTVLQQLASRQHVALELDVSGSMLWDLTVRNVRAVPTGKSPVRKITIQHLHFEYSIPSFFKGGIGEFLKSYEIRNADLDIFATPSTTEAERRQKRTLAEDLNQLLAQPALYADEATVENFNLLVQTPNDATRLEGLHLSLHPHEPGSLRVELLQLPNLPAWRKLSATTSYLYRNLVITDLELDPRIQIDRFSFDASRRAEKHGSLSIEARVFGGALALELEGTQLPQKGEHLKKSYDTALRVNASRINIASAVEYFGEKALPATRLTDLKIDIRGEPERPNTWTGTLGADVGSAALGNSALDHLAFQAEVIKGVARITKAGGSIGENTIAFTGQAMLPDSINRLRETDLEAGLEIDAPNLREATIGLLPEQPIRGKLTGSGTLTLKEQHLQTAMTLHAEKLTHALFQIASGEITGTLARPLEASPGAPLQNVKSKIAATFTDIRFKGCHVDSVELDSALADNYLDLTKLAILSGENSVSASGRFAFPEGRPVPLPISADFAIKLPELGAMGQPIDEDLLAGQIEGNGSLRTVNGRLTGTMQLDGTSIRLADFRARSLAAKVEIDEAEKTTLSLAVESFGSSDLFVEAAEIAGTSPDLIQRLRDGRWHEINTDLNAALTAPRFKQFNADTGEIEAKTRDGILTVTKFDVQRGRNSAAVSGTFRLLEGKLIPRPMDADYVIEIPDLAEFGVEVNQEILNGKIEGKGSVHLVNGKLSGKAELKAREVRIDGFHAGSVEADMELDENETARVVARVSSLGDDAFTLPEAELSGASSNIVQILNDARWDRLNASLSAQITAPRVKTFTADSAALEGEVREGLLTLDKLAVKRGENVANVNGTFRFQEGQIMPRPVDAKFTVNLPDLSAFGMEVNKETLDGSLQANGSVHSASGKFSGALKFEASDLAVNGFRVNELAGNFAMDESEHARVSLRAQRLRWNDFSLEDGTLTGDSLDFVHRLSDARWRELEGNVEGNFSKPRYRAYTAETGRIIGALKAGVLSVEKLTVQSGENTASLTGKLRLPETKSAPELIQADLRADIEDLSAFEVTRNNDVLNGRVQGRASVHGVEGQMEGTIQLEGTNLTLSDFRAARITAEGTVEQHQTSTITLRVEDVISPDLAIKKSEVKVSANELLARKRGGVLENLDANISAIFSELRYKTFHADAAEIVSQVQKRIATVEKFRVTRGENSFTADGSVLLPSEGEAPIPITVNYLMRIPELADFGFKVKEAALRGQLQGIGAIHTENGELRGSAELTGSALQLGDFKASSLQGTLAATGKEITVEELRLHVSAGAEIAASGKIGVSNEQPYEGAVLALAKDLSVFEPLLAALGIEKELRGSLDLTVESSGQLRPQRHEGQVKLEMDKARFGDLDLKRVRLAGLFGPAFAETSEFQIVSGVTQLSAGLSWGEKKLRIRDIDLRQGTQQVFTGFVTIPFDPGSAAGPIPMDQRIAANVNARNLDIAAFLKTLGQTSPVNGMVTVNLVAGGTILRPTLHLKLAGRGLTSSTAPSLKPAEIDVVSHYSNNELTLDLTARQPQIQPLTVRGKIPLNLEGAIQQKKLDPNLPLDLTVHLPPTSLGILANLVPSLRSIEGTTAVDARIGGTVRKPEFSGAASLRIGYARFTSEGVPAIGRLDANIAFTNEGLQIRTFRGEVGGGTFQLSGGIRVPKWFEPVFDLRLVSDSVLVRRDDSVTIRVDTDIKATGPLAAGAVRGTIWITQSRFFRDIEILPIGLPGRPKPKPSPKSAPFQQNFAITTPPFNHWTFDIAIKTRPNDLFEIRGNLATGNAAVDLRFGGTGAEPWLEGIIRVENFKATLPFSELEVSRGFITFSRSDFLRPNLDILAESRLRDYHINAYIYGSPENPQLSLTSEPPLPQQDIISLLATGTTTSELTGRSDVLAGRAAVLVLEQLYRKIFKKQPSAQKDPFLDRFKVDLGAVDSRTGRQEVSASFRLGDNLYLIGDIDVAGEFAGRLRYLIRFR